VGEAKTLRVVIVDDEAPARSRLRELLADCAGEIAITVAGEAASGPEAIELLAATPADVVLLDVRMPEMDGIARAARTHLCAQERGKVHLIPVKDVVYLKAELKYVTVRTAAREYLIEEALTKLEEEFGERFVRAHRNCLVARAAVRGFERTMQEGEAHWEVLLEGVDERIAVSRRQQHIVRELGKSGRTSG